MSLAKSMTACNESNGFLVVHGHAPEGFANVTSSGNWIRISIWTLRINVNQPHLHGTEGVVKFSVSTVTFVPKPSGFRSPVNVFFRFPDVFSSTCKAIGFQAHGLKGAVAGKNHKVCPRKPLSVLLLDRPQQSTGFVQANIVWPTVERRESEGTRRGPATTVANPIRSRTVPGHTDEKRTVVTVIGRPPVLGGCHNGIDVLLELLQVDFQEFFFVAEIFTHWV